MSRSGGEIARDDGPLHIAAQAALGVVCGTVVVLLDGLDSLAHIGMSACMPGMLRCAATTKND
jgi:hypothetical protein